MNGTCDAVIYNYFEKAIYSGGFPMENFLYHNIKAVLLTEDYKPDLENDIYYDDIKDFELDEVGDYKKGGVRLYNKSITKGVFTTKFGASDICFHNLVTKINKSIKYLTIYISDGNSKLNNRLIGVICYSHPIQFNGFGTTSFIINENGLFIIKNQSLFYE